MGNHAALIRAENAGKTVTRRGKRFIEFDNGDGTKRFVASIDPLHYGVSNDQEIDTTWQPDTGAWQWKLLENNFQIHSRNFLNSGDLIQWLDTRSGESVIVDPQSINWVDNLTDSRQQISTKQAVLATANDQSLIWTNGYGVGRHFRYTAHPRRLIKHVIIDHLSDLPIPTVSNPYFEIEFVLKRSAGVTLYVDGSPWTEGAGSKVTTANTIEYRLANGTVAWYVPFPVAEDSAGNVCPGVLQLRRQGANRFCTVRFPKSWIDTAVFPIYVDDSFTDGYGGNVTSDIDTSVFQFVTNNNYGASTNFGNSASWKFLLKFDLSSLTGTCQNASLALHQSSSGAANAFTLTAYSISSANGNWIEGTKTGAAASAGEPTWAGKEANGSGGVTTNWAGSAGLSTSGTDYEATSIGSQNGNQSDANGTEYAIGLTASRIEGWFGASNTNYGVVVMPSGSCGNLATSDNPTTGNRPHLNITYTPPSTGPNVNDTVAVSESNTITVQTSDITKSETITVTDTPLLSIETLINQFDIVNVAENVAVTLSPLAVNINETIGVAENIGEGIDASLITVSDNISVAENISVAIAVAGTLDVNVSDGITVAENIGIAVDPSAVNVNDGIVVSENINVSVLAAGTLSVNVSDNISLSESVSVSIIPLPTLSISVSDSINVTENINSDVLAPGTLLVNVSDQIVVTDTPDLAMAAALFVTAVENIHVAESVITFIGTTALITPDERVYRILFEDRVLLVEAEDRTWVIE